MKIDIITMHSVKNYGSALQTYATQYILSKKLKQDVEIIDYRAGVRSTKSYFLERPKGKYNKIKEILYLIYKFPERLLQYIVFENFLKKNISTTKRRYNNYEELSANLPVADIYMTGSDQTWTFVYGFDRAYFLDFTNKKKIAYAASFGKNTLSEDEISKIKSLLKEYNAISVREKTGLDILKQCDINNGKCLLDPTMMLSIKDWNDLYIQSKLNIKEKYLLIYMLGNVPRMYDYAKEIADKYGYKIIKFGWDYLKPKNVDKIYRFSSPVDFIYLFQNAQYIVTNSFHGTAFAINFNKPFITIPPDENNARFNSILDMTNLQSKNMYKGLNIEEATKKIDYNQINDILNKKREEAINFLKNNIKE